MGRVLRWIMLIALVGGAAAWGYSYYTASSKPQTPNYLTAEVRRGDLVSGISATGTIEPEDLIDVGAQVAGRILEFGPDSKGRPVDYGSEVKKDMILARIDDSTYQASVNMATAALNIAKANLERARADLGQFVAKETQTRREWERAKSLGAGEILSKTDYDTARSNYEVAAANLEVGRTAIRQAEAGVAQAQAELDRARQNLGYCTIKSPVDGVIIDRRVNIGQTVVASLNAPSLFLIAKDLKRVQIWVPVNEADIGQIHPGQAVNFTVDAFPSEKFQGKVGKVRLNAGMTQNVVTYTVEVTTDNSSGRLLPYLTANVQFETGRREDVLTVPNSALRWHPPVAGEQAGGPSGARRFAGGGGGGAGMAMGAGAGARGGDPSQARGKRNPGKGTLYVLASDNLREIKVDQGISDGINTEVSGPDLQEGMAVVTGIKVADTRGGGAPTGASPFIPQMPRGGGRGMR